MQLDSGFTSAPRTAMFSSINTTVVSIIHVTLDVSQMTALLSPSGCILHTCLQLDHMSQHVGNNQQQATYHVYHCRQRIRCNTSQLLLRIYRGNRYSRELLPLLLQVPSKCCQNAESNLWTSPRDIHQGMQSWRTPLAARSEAARGRAPCRWQAASGMLLAPVSGAQALLEAPPAAVVALSIQRQPRQLRWHGCQHHAV